MYASSLQSQRVSSSHGRFSALTSSTTCFVSLRTLAEHLVPILPLADGDGEESTGCSAAAPAAIPVAGDSYESFGELLVGSLGIDR